MLGDRITTSAYERNTKVTQSSYISKVNELRNAVPNAVESTGKYKLGYSLRFKIEVQQIIRFS